MMQNPALPASSPDAAMAGIKPQERSLPNPIPLPSDAAAMLFEGGTKRIGYILDVDDLDTVGGLNWRQASAVLTHLQLDENNAINDAHERLARENPAFVNAVKLGHAEEDAGNFTVENRHGHLYRSSTIKVDFRPDPENRPDYVPFTLFLVLAYTVCVQLATQSDEEKPQVLHSKFWYNAIIVPKAPIKTARALVVDLNAVATAVDRFGRDVLIATKGFYEAAVSKEKPLRFPALPDACRTIGDFCLEFRDPDFGREVSALEKRETRLVSTQGAALEFLKFFVREVRGAEPSQMLHAIASEGIETEFAVRRNGHSAKALYVVTTKGKMQDNGQQRAIGVTSTFQPRKSFAESCDGEPAAKKSVKGRDGYQIPLRELHARPSNSISTARVTREASWL